MRRVLSIELRRSAAAGAALVLLVVGAVAMYATTKRWSGGWMALAMVQREYLMLLSPLAMATGAWQSYREHRANVAELFSSAPRPRTQRVVPILAALGLAALVAYLLTTAVAVPWLVGIAGYLPLAVVPVVAVGALLLVVSTWIGLAVGRLVPALATAPALAVVGFGVQAFGPALLPDDGGLAGAFLPGYGMGQFTGYETVPGATNAAAVVWLVALAAAGFVLFVARTWRVAVAALLPVAVGAAAVVAIAPTGAPYTRAQVDTVAQELVCTSGDAPRVCVSRARSGLLDEITPKARHALAALAKIPGNTVVEAHEDTTTYVPLVYPADRPDTALMTITTDKRGHLANPGKLEPEMLSSLFLGARTCERTDADPYLARAVASWLLNVAPVREEWDTADDLARIDAFKAKLDPATVAAIRAAALRCADTAGLVQ